MLKKYVAALFAGALLLVSCGDGDDGNPVGPSGSTTVYQSACHEIVATCDSNSACSAFAKELIKQKDLSQCPELKKHCSQSQKDCS